MSDEPPVSSAPPGDNLRVVGGLAQKAADDFQIEQRLGGILRMGVVQAACSWQPGCCSAWRPMTTG